MNWRDYIEQRPDIMMGKPVIKGTRLTVEILLESLSDGATETDLLAAYPRLQSVHIQAALAFAAASLSTELTVFADVHAE